MYQDWLKLVKHSTNLRNLIDIWKEAYEKNWHFDLIQYPILKRIYQITRPNPLLYLHLQAVANHTAWATLEEVDGKYLIEAFFFFPDDLDVLYQRLFFLLYQGYSNDIVRGAVQQLAKCDTEQHEVLAECLAQLSSQSENEIAEISFSAAQELEARGNSLFASHSLSFLEGLELKTGY